MTKEYWCRSCVHADVCEQWNPYADTKEKCRDYLAEDVVEVVRCKDCEHCMDATSWYNGYDKLCRIWGRSFQPVKNDDFCSRGKKKEV